jgi:hypothetical protein
MIVYVIGFHLAQDKHELTQTHRDELSLFLLIS